MKRLNETTVLTLVFCGFWAVILSNLNPSQVFAQQDKSDSLNLITPELIKPHIIKLSDDKYEGRGAGYKGERKAAEYIAKEFKKIGLKPVGDLVSGRRSYFQEFKFYPWNPVVAWETLTSRNILGFIEGIDPTLKNEIVVIGAHYDGQGRAGQADPTRQPPTEANAPAADIWNSANDNATSIAAILEIARAIKSGKITTKRSILFIAFGAEEHGMAGSMYYVRQPVFPLDSHAAMINLEKLGRSPEKPLSINGVASSAAWLEILKAAQEQTKTKVSPNVPFVIPDSDHYPFGASRIPAVMLYVSTGVDAHQPSDTADKIDFLRTAEAARLAMTMLLAVADREQRPANAASPIPDLGLVVQLITNAEADAAGLGTEESGLKVTGVIAGLPSAEAGLQGGDLIVDFAKRRFRRDDTVVALMTMHREILEGKFGISLPVTIFRNKKKVELIINLRR